MLGVHPLQLLGIKRGRRRVHPLDVELGDELVDRQHFAAVLGPPSEQREIVDPTRTAGSRRRGTPRPTSRRAASRACRHRDRASMRQVRVHRLIAVTEGAPQREHAVRRVDEVFAAQHVRDLHVDVVDRVGEEEHGRAVRAHDHEVGDRRPLDRNVTANHVGESARAFVGGAKANRARAAFGRRVPRAPRR